MLSGSTSQYNQNYNLLFLCSLIILDWNLQKKKIMKNYHKNSRRFSYKMVTSKTWEDMQTKLNKLLLTVIFDESLITSLATLSLLAHMRQLLHCVFPTWNRYIAISRWKLQAHKSRKYFEYTCWTKWKKKKRNIELKPCVYLRAWGI